VQAQKDRRREWLREDIEWTLRKLAVRMVEAPIRLEEELRSPIYPEAAAKVVLEARSEVEGFLNAEVDRAWELAEEGWKHIAEEVEKVIKETITKCVLWGEDYFGYSDEIEAAEEVLGDLIDNVASVLWKRVDREFKELAKRLAERVLTSA